MASSQINPPVYPAVLLVLLLVVVVLVLVLVLDLMASSQINLPVCSAVHKPSAHLNLPGASNNLFSGNVAKISVL